MAFLLSLPRSLWGAIHQDIDTSNEAACTNVATFIPSGSLSFKGPAPSPSGDDSLVPGAFTRPEDVTLFKPTRARLAIVVHCIGTSLLAIFSVARCSVASHGNGQAALPLILPLAAAATLGAWLLLLPYRRLEANWARSQTVVRCAHWASLIPPLLLQALAAAASRQNQFAPEPGALMPSIMVAGIQPALLLPSKAGCIVDGFHWWPLALGISLAIGEAVGIALSLIPIPAEAAYGFSQQANTGFLFLAPTVILVIGISEQVIWTALFAAVGHTRSQAMVSVQMRRNVRRLTLHNTKLEESLAKAKESQDKVEKKNDRVESSFIGMTSRFDSVMADVNGLWEMIQALDGMPAKSVDDIGTIIRRLKASLLSPDLFKAELKTGTPKEMSMLPGKAGTMRKMSATSVEQLKKIHELCMPERAKVLQRASGDLGDVYSGRATPLAGSVPGSASPSFKPGSSSHSSHLGSFRPKGSLSGLHGRMLTALREVADAQSGSLGDGDLFSRGIKASASSQLGSWNFKAYQFASETSNHPLATAGIYFGQRILEDVGLSGDSPSFRGFLSEVEQVYRAVPYHNSTHATDVLNSVMYFLQQDRKASRWPLCPVSRLAAFCSAVIHDVGHFGRTNRFHIMQHHPVSILFNDSSPLENMHCAIGFFILQQPNSGFLKTRSQLDYMQAIPSVDENCKFAELSDEDFSTFRRVVVEAVLATDMVRHVESLSRFRAAVNMRDESSVALDAPIGAETEESRACKVVGLYLKAADIAHSAKSLDQTKEMTIRIHREFFDQGDEEKRLGLPLSPLCDRDVVNIPKSQVGFCTCLVLPFYEVVHFYVRTPDMKQKCMEQIEANIDHWDGPNPCVLTSDIRPETPNAARRLADVEARVEFIQRFVLGGGVLSFLKGLGSSN